MSYRSKRTITNIVASILLISGYIVFALSPAAPAQEDLKTWAIVMLIFIGICIVALIIVQILFQIGYSIGVAIKERECKDEDVERIVSSSMVEDEMEKIIKLKAARAGYSIAGAGFIAALLLLVFNGTAVLALHIILGSFILGSIVEGCVSIYHNERGVHNA